MIRCIPLVLLMLLGQVSANEVGSIDCSGIYSIPMEMDSVKKNLLGKTNLLDELVSDFASVNDVVVKVFRATEKIHLVVFELDGYSNAFIVDKVNFSSNKSECLTSDKIQLGTIKNIDFFIGKKDLVISIENLPKGTNLSLQKVKYRYNGNGKVDIEK